MKRNFKMGANIQKELEEEDDKKLNNFHKEFSNFPKKQDINQIENKKLKKEFAKFILQLIKETYKDIKPISNTCENI